MILTEVAHAGIISNIHIRAAKTNTANARCCKTVIASRPSHETGMNHKSSVTAITTIKPIDFLIS